MKMSLKTETDLDHPSVAQLAQLATVRYKRFRGHLPDFGHILENVRILVQKGCVAFEMR
jgi:hypothetical protein